jgi:pimeloyl-ACP methyl ester carboxylesterase
VIFLHGWGAVHPRAYGAWIDHIVRKGHIVIFPRYQFEEQFRTPGDVMLAGAAQAVQDAWELLQAEGPVLPRADRIVLMGHSLGGLLAARIAAQTAALGLPPAGAILMVQPGGQDSVPVADLGGIPADAVMVIVTGDEDTVTGTEGALVILDAFAGDDGRLIEHVHMRSERRSRPALVAHHYAPLGVKAGFPPNPIQGGDTQVPGNRLQNRLREFRQNRYTIDALDYYGFWKIGDALLDAVFRGENLEYGFGNTDEQRFMGTLSDGTPVRPLLVE